MYAFQDISSNAFTKAYEKCFETFILGRITWDREDTYKKTVLIPKKFVYYRSVSDVITF